jgi:monofunctional biosynthetic peptidoglycan transglycosylase
MRMDHARTRFRCFVRLTWKVSVGLLLLPFLLSLPLKWVAPSTSAFMVRWCLTAWWQGQGCRIRYQWVDLEDISPFMALAVVAAEDQKFPHHPGFDLDALGEAWQAYQHGRGGRGGSTISQQVAKNLFLWPGRSLVRKGIEAYITLTLEVLWSKRRILEVYLNVAEFGPGIFGVAAASKTFFAKPAAHLSASEAALLAAVLPNPRQRHVARPAPDVLQRRAWILRQMHQLGGLKYLGDL